MNRKKLKLQKIGNKCADLSEAHKKERMKFDNLFEEIYGVEFDTELDNVVESIDYGNSNFCIEKLEKDIIFSLNSCNSEFNYSKLKNIDLTQKSGGTN